MGMFVVVLICGRLSYAVVGVKKNSDSCFCLDLRYTGPPHSCVSSLDSYIHPNTTTTMLFIVVSRLLVRARIDVTRYSHATVRHTKRRNGLPFPSSSFGQERKSFCVPRVYNNIEKKTLANSRILRNTIHSFVTKCKMIYVFRRLRRPLSRIIGFECDCGKDYDHDMSTHNVIAIQYI